MRRKKVFCLILICLNLLNTGCFSYRDINKLLFSTALVVDIDSENNPILYIEAFRPMEGNTEGQKLLLKGEGKTVFEALRNINLGTSFKFNVTQTKALIYTEKAAEYGLDYSIDFFDREQEFLVRHYLCVMRGDPEKLLSAKTSEGEYVGVFIDRLLDNVGTSSRAVSKPINDYHNQRLIGDRVNIVPLLEVRRDIGEASKVFVNGGAIIKDDKMIGVLSKEEGQGFNFLLNNVTAGTLEVANPEYPEDFITLEILKTSTKTNIKEEKQDDKKKDDDEKNSNEEKSNKIKLTKDIKVNTAIVEVQKGFTANDENLKQLRETAEENIRKACYQLFDKYKEEGTDIFDIKEEYLRRLRKEAKEDIIKDVELIVNVEVLIESGNDLMDFINTDGK